jgi:predicted ribosome quality control (RQC) complex YloA/Tae2 family protein
VPARIPYDSLTLRAVTDELRRALVGGMVQHVAQPTATDLVLTVRSRGANQMLLLSCDPTHARAHLTHIKRPNPAAPPAFCMLCRKHLEAARVREVEQRGFDRILDITLEDGEGRFFRLVAELMGKHSNLLLVHENGLILDAAKHVTRKVSRHRETLPGRPYIAPPEQEGRTDPFLASAEEIAAFSAGQPDDPEARVARTMGHFTGISPFLATELVQRAGVGSLEEAWDEIFGACGRGEWAPVVVRNARAEAVGAYPFPTVQYPPDAQNPRDSINTALDHFYGTALPRAALDAARHELATTIDRAIKAKERHRESLVRSLSEAGRAEEYKQTGELLLANLHAVEDGADAVTVIDYYAPDAPQRTIPLDPLKSPRENADVYFRRYHKAKDGAAIQREQMESTSEELASLRSAQGRLAECEDLADLKALRAELMQDGLMRGGQSAEPAADKRAHDFQGKKIRTIQTPEGWEIYLGENSEANDFLTSRVASPNDIWLHVRANASAHVVIRTKNEPAAVPQSVIQKAALLAARHSAAKHSSMVPVDYTLKKFVRRPRGSASGAALYRNEKTIYVSPKD